MFLEKQIIEEKEEVEDSWWRKNTKYVYLLDKKEFKCKNNIEK